MVFVSSVHSTKNQHLEHKTIAKSFMALDIKHSVNRHNLVEVIHYIQCQKCQFVLDR